MIDLRLAFLLSICCSPFLSRAQSELSGEWKLPDGSSVYELRLFEDGQVEARVRSTAKPSETAGRVVLDHIEAAGHAHTYKAVIHSAGTDVPREAILSVKEEGNTLDVEIPRPLSNVHITWRRVSDEEHSGSGSSTLSLNE